MENVKNKESKAQSSSILKESEVSMVNTKKSKKQRNNKRRSNVYFIQRHLFKNAPIKLISLSLALILYIYVDYSSIIVRSVQVEVIEPELPKNLVLLRKIPPFINVKFYGTAEQMDFEISNFKIELENPNPVPGKNLYIATLKPEPPQDVKVSYANELQLFIDRLLTRELSVIPQLELALPESHELGYISINPRTVMLKGPYEALSSMTHVNTENLRITEVVEVLSRRVLIVNLPDFVNFAPNQPFQAELSINILPKAKDDYVIIKNVSVVCINNIPDIEMQIPGKTAVNLYISPQQKLTTRRQFRAYVFCPVFFDKASKSLRPSFAIQNQLVFSTNRLGVENIEVLKIIPPQLSLQFKWIGK